MATPSRFEGKAAIVTGAAQGIGAAVAERLAREGAFVLIVDCNGERAAAVAQALTKQGVMGAAFQADMTKPSEIAGLVEHAMGLRGRIDVLVNNASNVAAIGAADGDVVNTSMETWDSAYACNLRGPAAACKYAIPHMIAGGGGSIVNVASVQGLGGDVVRVAYGATKAGLIMLTQYVATAFGAQGVRCNSVAPGLVMSESARDVGVEPFLQLVTEHMAMPRRGQPADLADVIAFLASDEAKYVAGQNLTVDGGLTAHLPWMADLRRAAPAS